MYIPTVTNKKLQQHNSVAIISLFFFFFLERGPLFFFFFFSFYYISFFCHPSPAFLNPIFSNFINPVFPFNKNLLQLISQCFIKIKTASEKKQIIFHVS